jgi:hypothetical protein
MYSKTEIIEMIEGMKKACGVKLEKFGNKFTLKYN